MEGQQGQAERHTPALGRRNVIDPWFTGAENWPIVTAVCCREWPVAPIGRMARCGYCGQVPQVIRATTADPVDAT